MSNMSYVRFENTLRDLRDCELHMDDDFSENMMEWVARKKLIAICKRIADEYHEPDCDPDGEE